LGERWRWRVRGRLGEVEGEGAVGREVEGEREGVRGQWGVKW
jgi:hypothetical protein